MISSRQALRVCSKGTMVYQSYSKYAISSRSSCKTVIKFYFNAVFYSDRSTAGYHGSLIDLWRIRIRVWLVTPTAAEEL